MLTFYGPNRVVPSFMFAILKDYFKMKNKAVQKFAKSG